MLKNGIKMSMKNHIFLLILVCAFGVLISCKNTPLDKVLDGKKENPENYQNNIFPIQEKERSENVSKDVIKAAADGVRGLLDLTKIGSSHSEKGGIGSVSSGKPFYSAFEEKQKDFGDVNHVSMSYNAAPINEIVPAFAKILDFDFYLDPNVKGVVTMTVDSNISKKEIWMIFEQILLFSGAYCSLDSGIVHIQPLNMMSQERRLGPGFGYEANVSVVLFRLSNAKSTTLVQQLKPFMTNGAVLVDMADQNSVLIVETPTNVPKLKAIVGMLDVSTRATWPKTVVRCVNVPPTKVAEELAKILPVLGLPVQDVSTPDSASAKKDLIPGSINIQGVDRLQLLVVSAANSEVIDEIKKWVDVLDRNDVGDQSQVYVYNVMHGRAEDLVQTLSVIFSVQGAILTPAEGTQAAASAGGASASPFATSGGGSSSASSSPKSASLATAYGVTQLAQKQQPPQQPPEDPKTPKKTPVDAFDVPSNVMADAINQRLIIKAAPRTYAIMKALLDRIDTIPKQVLLDIFIADVSLKNNTSIGTEFKGVFGSSRAIGTDYGASTDSTATAPLGFEYLLMDQGKKSIFIHALQTTGRTTTLASPQILVQSNTQAKVMIGQEVPIASGSVNSQVSGGGGTPAVSNSFTYKNTGVIVNATPRITRGNFVSIDFNENLSSLVDSTVTPATTSGTFTNPTINSRQLTTTLVLPDGGTILIGGLIQDKRTDGLSTVPFFGNIPFINRLLGQTSANIERTEMLVLLTVNIINKTSDVEAMSERYKESIAGMKKLFSEDWKDANRIFEQDESKKIYVK